jgi:hypothetical protein
MIHRLPYPAVMLAHSPTLPILVHDMITNNSDLQIRRRWKGVNGVALWDKYKYPSAHNLTS